MFVFGATIIAFVIVATLGFVWYQASHYEEGVESKAGLYAQLVNEKNSSMLSQAESITLSLASRLSQVDNRGEEQLKALFESEANHPEGYLRSISLVAEDGQVVASSFEQDRGGVIQWKDFGSHEGFIGSLRLGPLLFGRHLTSLTQQATQSRSALLPMIKRVQLDGSQSYFLIALINLEFVANEFEAISRAEHFNIAMVSDKGEFLASNRSAKIAPGSRIKPMLSWWKLATIIDQGVLANQGFASPDAIGIYRASKNWPVVFIVERSKREIYANTPDGLIGVVLSALALCGIAVAGLMVLSNGVRRTERHHVESQRAFSLAASSEKRKYAILQASQEAVVTVNSKGLIVEYNLAAEKMFGSEVVRNKNTPIGRLVLPAAVRAERRNDLFNYFEQGSHGESAGRLEIIASRQDGSTFPVEFTISKLIDQDEVFYTLSARDISERYRSEQTLKKSERRLKHALAAAGDGVWDFDVLLGTITYSSNGLAMLGYIDGAIEGNQKSWMALIHPDDVEPVNAALITHLVGKSLSFSVECRMWCANGTWKWIHSRGAVVQRKASSGQPLRLVGTHSDISERKNAQSEHAALLAKSWELTDQLNKAHEIELKVGSQIQRSLLVNTNQKRLTGLWLSSFNQASQGVDGDFFDVLNPDSHTIDIVAGDVMGKGVNAALMGAAVKMQLSRSMLELVTDVLHSRELPQPTDVLASLHREITPHLQALDAFVTISYIRINTSENTVTWIGCGHEEPTLCRSDGTLTVLQNEHPPLGVMNEVDFEQHTTTMLPWDSIFIHSDGVSDALLSNGNRLGLFGLREGLTSLLGKHGTPAAIIHQLRKKLFGTGTVFTDDLTMILATRVPLLSRFHREELSMALSEIARVRTFVAAEAMDAGLSPAQVAMIVLASVEVFTNIVRHTTGGLEGAPIELLSSRPTDFLQIDFVFLGNSYIPPTTPARIDYTDLPEGGFGLRIIDAACDQVDYLQSNGVNTIRLRKALHEVVHTSTDEVNNLVTLSPVH